MTFDESIQAEDDAAEVHRLRAENAALRDALLEMMAAHQRADPHPPERCTNCTAALKVL